MTRALLAVAALALAALPASAHAVPVLAEEDSNELAQTLADATEVQNVCYGWSVEVDDAAGVESGLDEGSSLGPGRRLQEPLPPNCAKWVQLVAGVVYTSESSESEDSAGWEIESAGLERPPTLADLADLGYDADRLLDDDNDTALINAVGALPAIVADKGEAPPVPFEPERQPAGAQGQPTNTPGSDFLRENGALLAVSALLFLVGAFWLVMGLTGRAGPAAKRVRKHVTD